MAFSQQLVSEAAEYQLNTIVGVCVVCTHRFCSMCFNGSASRILTKSIYFDRNSFGTWFSSVG